MGYICLGGIRANDKSSLGILEEASSQTGMFIVGVPVRSWTIFSNP